MFEELNKEEVILKRMMDKVPSWLDKREGSIIYNALAPVALELAMSYSNLDKYLEYAFINEDTPDVYIEKRANEIGIKRKPTTKAVKKARFYDHKNILMDIPLNSRFSVDGVNFKAISKIDVGVYAMECEKYGAIGNNLRGRLVPIDYINNLGKGELDEVLQYGVEIETGKELYSRIIEREQNPTTSGNPNHYKQWALEVNGVGKCKVYPLGCGEGSVKIIIVDNDKKTASSELIDKVFKHIEEVRPIGPKIFVCGAIEKKLNIAAKVILLKDSNLTKEQQQTTKNRVKQDFLNLFDRYLKDRYFEIPYVSLAKIISFLLSIDGVIDCSDVKINGVASNLIIEDGEIPVVDTIVLEV